MNRILIMLIAIVVTALAVVAVVQFNQLGDLRDRIAVLEGEPVDADQ